MEMAPEHLTEGGDLSLRTLRQRYQDAVKALSGEAVGLLRSENEDRMRLRYVGPQPPYSFLEPMKTGELSWD